jgi:hypothetical protein
MAFKDSNERTWKQQLVSMAWAAFALLTMACGGGGGGDAAAAAPALPAYVRYASLGGAQEVPPNASTATGVAAFSLNPGTKVLTGTVTTAGLTATGAHIHEGAAGVAGPVVIALTGGTGGVWAVPAGTVLTDAQVAAIQANSYYVNVHSAAFPAGEIRGQINLRVSFATLSGAQETPAVVTSATGYGSLALNPVTGAVSGSVLTSGITGTGAHIHEGATGAAGGILISLVDAGGGLWTVPPGATLTAGQVTSWANGNLYVNVHSSANPGGEIRGQLNLAAPLLQATTLSGAKEVPANASMATGTATVGLNPFTLELSGGISTTGLTATGAHIHQAAAGVSGPVILPLDDGGSGTWLVPSAARLTSDQFASWMAGSLYVNVHSAAYPAGEIRGQLGTTGGGTGGGGTGGGGY